MRGFGAISLILTAGSVPVEHHERAYSPPNADDEVNLRLSRDVEVTRSTGCPLQADLLLLRGKVLLHVGLRALENNLALGLSSLDSRFTNDVSIVC